MQLAAAYVDDPSIPYAAGAASGSQGYSAAGNSFTVGDIHTPNSSAQYFQVADENRAKQLYAQYGGNIVRANPSYSYINDPFQPPITGYEDMAYYWSPLTGNQYTDFLFAQKNTPEFDQHNQITDAVFTIATVAFFAYGAAVASGLLAAPGSSIATAGTTSATGIGATGNVATFSGAGIDYAEVDAASGLTTTFGSSGAYDAAIALPGASSSIATGASAMNSITSAAGAIKSAVGVAAAVGAVGGAKSSTGAQAATPVDNSGGQYYNASQAPGTLIAGVSNTVLAGAALIAVLLMKR